MDWFGCGGVGEENDFGSQAVFGKGGVGILIGIGVIALVWSIGNLFNQFCSCC